MDGMEVHLSPEIQAKLNRLAAQQRRNAESLVHEAVERLVDYDEWLMDEVKKGLAAADRGEFIDHEDIGKTIDSRYHG
jgi:predicted transcriptional regulator